MTYYSQTAIAENTSKDVWADSAYRSEEKELILELMGYRSGVQKKKKKNKPLSKRDQRANKTKSRIRVRVEPGIVSINH